MKRVLLIAYHYPPFRGSSGVQRALRLAQHLPQLGWQPIVLTAAKMAYETVESDKSADVAPDVLVKRAFALDAARHLSLFSRYPAAFAVPDRWATWWLSAVPLGLWLISRYRPSVIWSTYPIATAHSIGATLACASGLPWVADFRDPMVEDGYPAERMKRRAFERVEARTVSRAARLVFTTGGMAHLYQERYPRVGLDRFRVIENGFEEDVFVKAEQSRAEHGRPPSSGARARPVVLLHSGIVYPDERNPVQMLLALRRLLQSGRIKPQELRIVFRAPIHAEYLSGLLHQYGLEEVVQIKPLISYQEAILEMLSVDALLVLQASSCNRQIPAKLYDYLRARKPILGLTDPEGDTAAAMRRSGIGTVARLNSAEDIERLLPEFVDQVRAGLAPIPGGAEVAGFSRLARSRELCALLEELVAR